MRYCARPPFALERLELLDAARVVYRWPRPQRVGATALTLTPLELIDPLAALIPPPRRHRHRHHGVLSANSPTRVAATAFGCEVADATGSSALVRSPLGRRHRMPPPRRVFSGPCSPDRSISGCSSRDRWSARTLVRTYILRVWFLGLSRRKNSHPVNPHLGKCWRLGNQEPGFGTWDMRDGQRIDSLRLQCVLIGRQASPPREPGFSVLQS